VKSSSKPGRSAMLSVDEHGAEFVNVENADVLIPRSSLVDRPARRGSRPAMNLQMWFSAARGRGRAAVPRYRTSKAMTQLSAPTGWAAFTRDVDHQAHAPIGQTPEPRGGSVQRRDRQIKQIGRETQSSRRSSNGSRFCHPGPGRALWARSRPGGFLGPPNLRAQDQTRFTG
jgi:hypothetical protein